MSVQLTVAVPWSLTHYIPLNGFHPLYRALFESKPDWVNFAAWDNIELSQKFRDDGKFKKSVLQEIKQDTESLKLRSSPVEKKYFDHFWGPNLALSRLLPGDIEFHHTAPYPTLERPFVFHCESFAPIFYPFADQGTGNLTSSEELRAHYRAIFEHPLCFGIFSHLPKTLEDINRFFASPIINSKLSTSRIGLHGSETMSSSVEKAPLSSPLFLFVNRANKDTRDFFLCGWHLALRYWQLAYPEPGSGRLIMRCARPMDHMLAEYGVDLDWLRLHEHRSVIWIENYLPAAELELLMQAAHFFLLPSGTLHSVSIMSAMAAGAVPIVSDTLGADHYVKDGVDGIVLQGVYASNWHQDAETGGMIDRYQRNVDLEGRLVQQLSSRIGALLAQPEQYAAMQSESLSKAQEEFSGCRFSEDFWHLVQQRYQDMPKHLRTAHARPLNSSKLAHCMVDQEDWQRIFTSTPQPVERLYTGQGRVTELGGCFISSLPANSAIELNDWSPVAEYVDNSTQPLIFAADIKGLGGRYLGCPIGVTSGLARQRFVEFCAEQLMPFPKIYSMAASLLKYLRRLYRAVRRRLPVKALTTKVAVINISTDIQLVAEGVKGLNIIRCGHRFYAIPQGAGEFSQAKAHAGGYDPCVSGTSLKDVLRKLDDSTEHTINDIELVEEGLRGFNLIRSGSAFYAIPKSEGAFDMARVQSGQYSRIHSGASIEAVRQAILGSAS